MLSSDDLLDDSLTMVVAPSTAASDCEEDGVGGGVGYEEEPAAADEDDGDAMCYTPSSRPLRPLYVVPDAGGTWIVSPAEFQSHCSVCYDRFQSECHSFQNARIRIRLVSGPGEALNMCFVDLERLDEGSVGCGVEVDNQISEPVDMVLVSGAENAASDPVR